MSEKDSCEVINRNISCSKKKPVSLNILLFRKMDLLCEDCKSQLATQSENIKERVLHHAVAIQHDKCMEVSLKAGADVNWADDSSNTPLMTAAKDG